MKALMLIAAAALPLPISGCGSVLVYDPYWRDYHPWNPGENQYYRQWEVGSNRDHVDFPNRFPGDQLAYWHGAINSSRPRRLGKG